MPVMDDNFVVLFISTTINATVMVIIYLWVVLPGKEPLAMVSCKLDKIYKKVNNIE